MFWKITTFPYLRTHREVQWALRVFSAALVIGLAAQYAWAESNATSLEPFRQESEKGASGINPSSVSVGAASAEQVPTPPTTEVHSAPAISAETKTQRNDALEKTLESAASVNTTTASAEQSPTPLAAVAHSAPITSTEILVQRIDALAEAVKSASVKQPAVDPWQDTKSIVLNIISNRIDSWLFGDGKERVGFATQIVAALAFIIAIIRFLLSFAMLNPATPPTKWGKFKAWTRQSVVMRLLTVAIGALAVVYTGAALYVVMSARSVPDVSQTSITALQESLTTCQTALAKKQQPQQPQAPPPVSLPTGALLGLEAMERLKATCESAIQAPNPRLLEIERSIVSIDSKQPWTFTKIVAFLAWVYLLLVVTYLLWRKLVK